MRKLLVTFILVLAMTLMPFAAISESIDVLIKGVDDGIKTSKQQDYKEAVMNAKLQAIERAGVQIASITKVVNFQMKYDMVESKAEAVLLPGFQVMDMGYQGDGSYQVVLAGKVQVGKDEGGEPGTMHVLFNGIDIFETGGGYSGDEFCGCILRTLSPIEFYLKKVGDMKGQLIESIDYGELGVNGLDEFYTSCGESGEPTIFVSRSNVRCKTGPFRERIKRKIEIPIVTNTKYVLWVYTRDYDHWDYHRKNTKLISRPFVFEVKSPITDGMLVIPLVQITFISRNSPSDEEWRVFDDANIRTELFEIEELEKNFINNSNYQPKSAFFRIKPSNEFDPSRMYNDI